MASGPWTLYYSALTALGDGTFDMDASNRWRVILASSSYTPSASTHSAYSDVSTYELSTANGYTAGGQALTQTWTRSTSTVTFDAVDPDWTASGGQISARYAVIVQDADANGTLAAGDRLLAYCLLDTTPADHTANSGSHFVIQLAASGILTLAAA